MDVVLLGYWSHYACIERGDMNRGVSRWFGRRRLFKILNFFSPVGGAAAAFIDYRRRRLESFYFFSSVGGAAAVFSSYRRRGGSEVYKWKILSKKKIYLSISISECQSIQKTIENNYYVPPHDLYKNQSTKLKLTSADTYKQ